jgi:hypothetical protein
LKGAILHDLRDRELPAIDLGLARGVSVTALARRYDLSTDAIYRASV